MDLKSPLYTGIPIVLTELLVHVYDTCNNICIVNLSIFNNFLIVKESNST